ncbi:hypothetical protein [Streptomyces alfalfae]
MLAQLADPGDTETTPYWVIYEDGSVGHVATTGGAPELAKPGRLVTEAEYQERAGQLAADRQAYLDALAAEDLARTRAAYEAFLAASFPEAVARQMSGYTGPPLEPVSGQSVPADS